MGQTIVSSFLLPNSIPVDMNCEKIAADAVLGLPGGEGYHIIVPSIHMYSSHVHMFTDERNIHVLCPRIVGILYLLKHCSILFL